MGVLALHNLCLFDRKADTFFGDADMSFGVEVDTAEEVR